ncbi:MAG: membrane protein insertase YidC [Saccharofermentans sp.]|nr:membrane protein insertase YidC [Saccharofermentans sp.]
MTFLSSLYTLVISPLELLFEVIFTIANRIIVNEGLSIIFLSLAVNFLVLPLYKRADELQTEERDIQLKMAPMVKHIKSTFKGDERFMMLQEYYRINSYKPVYALRSTFSVLLQIPFFIAAYNLLSGMQSLQGMPFGFISDLGKEDAMFMIGSFPVNILPILMTLINVVSGIIYTKGHPLKEKIQVYGLAAVFLVLLYRSPSGLVFYWLLNNVFSLAKNIFYRLKFPEFAKRIEPKANIKPLKKEWHAFCAGTIMMAIFTGLLIPSAVIDASVEEFIDPFHPENPFFYIIHSLLLSIGSWILWVNIFYYFSSNKTKNVFDKTIWIICGISAVNYFFFGTKLGFLSSTLQYEKTPSFTIFEYILNTLVVLLISVLFHVIQKTTPQIARTILIIGIVTAGSIGVLKSAEILGSYHGYRTHFPAYRSSSVVPEIPLSKTGNNVIVIMLDRALGTQVPYIINEKQELKEQFDGFTYYPNTISFGSGTLAASPALFGGYEYTPKRINQRSSESLENKHDEALKVMPAIFGNNGYSVTICDPPFAGYKTIPDLSIYDDYPAFNCYITNGLFPYSDEYTDAGTAAESYVRVNEMRNRNLFCFSLMKTAPLILQDTIYDQGRYNESVSNTTTSQTTNLYSLVQSRSGISISSGYSSVFLQAYPVLYNLPNITTINDSEENTFLMITNDTTHSPCLLQEPDYVPSMYIDNTAYDTDMVSRYTVNGETMSMVTEEQVIHYHVNMAAFLQLGKWFDYMRDNDVYDNTRIIIVADHGWGLNQFGITCGDQDLENFMPLLMVKDFNSKGFTTSDELMTNGDTPTIATSGIIENPVNPFTGNPINSELKNGPQTIFFTDVVQPDINSGNTFLPGSWYSVEGNPHDPNNWVYLGEG